MTVEQIRDLVAARYRVSWADLMSDRKPRDICRPRQIGMYLCRHYTDSTIKEIGAAFGKSPSAVTSSVKRVAWLLATDLDYRSAVEEMTTLVVVIDREAAA